MASCKLLILSLLLLLQLANGQLIYNWIWRNFIAPQLQSGVTSNIAASLGVWWQQNAPFIRSYSGQTYNVSQLLGQAIRCSGRYCVDLTKELKNKPDLPDVNAKVLLWSPKIVGTKAGNDYDPRTKDWQSVASTCRALFAYEKRMANFVIRASFHDSLSVDVRDCPGPRCGGADSSLLLTVEELTRPENAYDSFSARTARAMKKIASFFDASVADTMAVCAAVAPEVLSNGRIKIIGDNLDGLRVGRLDSDRPTPPNQLPAADASPEEFTKFWSDRGFTEAEAVALMGSHALIDEQGCFEGPKPNDYCSDPLSGTCTPRMFKWENHFYRDICSPEIRIEKSVEELPEPLETPILGMTEPEMDAEIRRETCKFTSKEFQTQAINDLRAIQAGLVPDPDLDEPPPSYDISWGNRNCTAGQRWGVQPSNCPHANQWFYTVNDAFLGRICQGEGSSPTHQRLRDAARRYLVQSAWDQAYRSAYIKMVTRFARWAPKATTSTVFTKGEDCPSGTTLDPTCAQADAGAPNGPTVKLYNTCPSCRGQTCWTSTCCTCVNLVSATYLWLNSAINCDRCCVCSTAFRTLALNTTANRVERVPAAARFPGILPSLQMAPAPLPEVPDTEIPEVPHADVDDDDDEIPDISENGGGDGNGNSGTLGPLSDPPRSPYLDQSSRDSVCPSSHGASVQVDGYPASPWRWEPFTRNFSKPAHAQRARSYCKGIDAATSYCVDAYEIDIVPSTIDMGCPAGRTRVLTYNGTIPGPTFRTLKGRQTLIRFNNRLTTSTLNQAGFSPYTPCDTTSNRQGRPISVHLHGEASLAAYDGWAEDLTCGGESKDYYYANRRPALAWYHDHALEITSENAYYGLSGMYIVHDRAAEGGCGEPWNMDNIPDTEMQFKDAVLDSKCQLYYDRASRHKKNLYGDINIVNGIPWPVYHVDARWHRFRWLNAAVTRPWKLRIVSDRGEDVSSVVCKVVAGEGGVRRDPAPYPAAGVFMGVAERYEVVCDFGGLAGRTLYLWNARDDYRMKDVPFFCHSHLVMKFVVRGCSSSSGSKRHLLQDTTTTTTDGTSTGITQDGSSGTDPAGAGTDPGAGGGAEGGSATGGAGGGGSTTGGDGGVTPGGGDAGTGGDGAATNRGQVIDPASFTPRCSQPGTDFDASTPSRPALDDVLSADDISQALQMVANKQCTRTFKFGRRGGQWVINGDTWHTARVAAGDVGHNAWELWCLDTGGGWFHPIHIHLVDFYVLARNDDPNQVHEYERWTAKDVVQLDPSASVTLLLRFGPHRGEYMFHCHNLVHEDTEMMRSFHIQSSGRTSNSTALPLQRQPTLVTSNNVLYDLYDDPANPSFGPKWTSQQYPLSTSAGEAATRYPIDRGIYRLFYPGGSPNESPLLTTSLNPWRVNICKKQS